MTTMPQQNETTELARERGREAAERTLTSWIQGCMTLIGFGLAYETASGATGAPYAALIAIAVALFLLTIAIVGHVGRIKTMEGRERFNASVLYALSAGGIIVFGIAATSAVILQAR